MAADVLSQSQFIREAPEIEAQKLALLQSAKAQEDATNLAGQQGRFLTPNYQIAGMSGNQLNAIRGGQEGIGAYQPYMTNAYNQLGQGQQATATGVDVLRSADTRNQFDPALAAMGRAVAPIASMGQSATLATQGLGLIGEGSTDVDAAQRNLQAYAQANLAPSQKYLEQSVAGMGGIAGLYDPSSVSAFMNPYQQQVIDAATKQINRQGDIQRQNLQAQAVRSGAFGGSREGIQQRELDRAIADQSNAAIIGALSSGYNTAQQQAQQAFEQQKQRQFMQNQYTGNVGQTLGQQQLQQAQLGQAAGSNLGQLGVQQAGLSGLYGGLAGQQANIYGQQAGANMNLGQGIGGLAAQQFGIGSQLAQGFGGLGAQQGNLATQSAALGQTAQGLGQQDVNFLYNLGSTQQKQQQAELDAQRQNQLQQNMQPYQQLGFLSDIYKGAPSTQMGVTTSSQATPSPFQQIAGLGIAGLSAAAAAGKAGIL